MSSPHAVVALLALLLPSTRALAADELEEGPLEASLVPIEQLERLCRDGDARACHRVARRYHTGQHGAVRDPLKAEVAYEAACRGGVHADCGYAAWYFVTEAPDATRAAALATMGCTAGDVGSCFVLGHLQLLGAGVPRDVTAGLARLEAGCAAPIPEACADLGVALAGGVEGVTPDPDRATPLLRTACDTDKMAVACGALGTLALQGRAPDVDAAEGRRLVALACDQGDVAACETHGAALLQGLGGAADATAAAPRLEKACAGGRALSCSQLADMALKGQGMAADRAKAIAWAKQGCAAGDTNACRQLDDACTAGAADACR